MVECHVVHRLSTRFVFRSIPSCGNGFPLSLLRLDVLYNIPTCVSEIRTRGNQRSCPFPLSPSETPSSSSMLSWRMRLSFQQRSSPTGESMFRLSLSFRRKNNRVKNREKEKKVFGCLFSQINATVSIVNRCFFVSKKRIKVMDSSR
jgi:hypothetical protein